MCCWPSKWIYCKSGPFVMWKKYAGHIHIYMRKIYTVYPYMKIVHRSYVHIFHTWVFSKLYVHVLQCHHHTELT